MAKSKIIGVRIPDHLLREIENFGLMNFPKNDSFDMTKSLLFLIQRGLQTEGIESPKSPAPSPSGDLDIDSNFKIHVLKDIENLKGLINDYQKLLKDNIGNLESQIDEFKESQIAINDRLYSKIENLESQSNQDVKPLIDENKQDDTPPPVISKFYPNQKIFKPYHVEQFKVIYDLLIGFKITFLSTKNNDAIQQWIISDQEGNKAGLFLNGASHWSLENVNFGDGDLKGFFEDCNFNDNYLDDLLIANNIDLDEIAEGADQVGAPQETDSPDPLVVEVNDGLLNTLTPDQQSVILAIVEGKSENEIKSLIPVTGNKLYLQGLAKSLGFKNVTSMGINKLIPLMKNSIIIANK